MCGSGMESDSSPAKFSQQSTLSVKDSPQSPQVVLCDLNMEAVPGITVLHPGGAHPPVAARQGSWLVAVSNTCGDDISNSFFLLLARPPPATPKPSTPTVVKNGLPNPKPTQNLDHPRKGRTGGSSNTKYP